MYILDEYDHVVLTVYMLYIEFNVSVFGTPDNNVTVLDKRNFIQTKLNGINNG